MSHKQPEEVRSRRNLLKSLAAGGGALVTAKSLPGSWVAPVVDSVVLPAHAATSAHLPSAGAAALVTTQNETGNRFARLMNEFYPAADAVPQQLFIVYVCVHPSPDGKQADIEVYVGENVCSDTSAAIVIRFAATSVPVPSTANLVTKEGDICSAGIGDLMERLGIVKTAHADGVNTVTVDIDSVEDGAEGAVHLVELMLTYSFDIPPGDCAPPACCGM
ncbi:MAG: twin-arginine translocation signal domain-containing protein [Arenicellales bacterium]